MYNFTWQDFSEKADSQNYKELYSLKEVSSFNINKKNNEQNHIFIEGDNYPSLKLLDDYKEKISVIYIDPPYNTGKKNFIYNDNFSIQHDKHSSWLSFMYRRLNEAKKLLKDDGCIFISIGQEELYNLKLLCDKIFGEENFINDFMYLHGKGKKDMWSRTMYQSNLCYAKDKKNLKPFLDCSITDWAIKNVDNDKRGNWFSGSLSFTEKRSNPNHHNYYEITSPSGIKWTRQWHISKEEMQELINQNKIYWGKAPLYKNVPRKKIFNGEQEAVIPKNIITDAFSTRQAQVHLDKLLQEKKVFDNPKPVNLIEYLLQITNLQKDAIILDFFAGSGTTFEAVINLNKKDNGKRKCIIIQKPENIEKPESKFKTISQLCYTRIKAVINNINNQKDSLVYYKLEEK